MKFSKAKYIGTIASAASLCVGIALSSLPAFASAGGSDRGGGDLCEDRIKTVRDDLKGWIAQDGHQALSLPSGISAKAYSDRMLSALNTARVQCVGPGDADYPVQIEGIPKICSFSHVGDQELITCDMAKFLTLTESNQYILIHHEYAGLANVETPNGADSHYEISNQISEYLINQMVKKLAVKSLPTTSLTACTSINTSTVPVGTQCSTSKGAVYERVSRDGFGVAWKGPDGVTWGDVIGTAAQYDAEESCDDLGGKLPRKADFEHGLANGFFEVLPNSYGRFFWTSTSTGDKFAIALDTRYNPTNFGDLTKHLKEFYRCIAR